MVRDKFLLPNAIYMADVWHLPDSILLKKFGNECFNLISSCLKGMIYSHTEEDFENCFRNAMTLLTSRDVRNLKLETTLQDFKNEKESYATFILCKQRGTRGKHGSSISEMNHSSVLKQGVHLYKFSINKLICH